MSKPVFNITRLLLAAALVMTALLIGGCITEKPAVEAPKEIIHFPIGVAVHPAGRYAVVVNANFNQAYKNGSLVVIDLKTFEIIPKWTIPIGTFGGEVIFNHSGTRMFVSVRGVFEAQDGYPEEEDNVVLSFDIDPDKTLGDPSGGSFIKTGSRHAIEVSSAPFGLAADFNDRYIYVTHITNGEVTVLEDAIGKFTDEDEISLAARGERLRRCVPENLYCPELPSSSYTSDRMWRNLCNDCTENDDCGSLSVIVPGAGEDGECMYGIPFNEENSCLKNHRRPGRNFCATYCEVDVSIEDACGFKTRIGCPEGFRCEAIRPFHKVTERKFSRGGNQAAISPLTGTVVISHRDTGSLGIIRPYYSDGLGYRTRVQLIGYIDGFDMRGLAFNPSGDKLFVAARNLMWDTYNKPGVLVIDTSIKYSYCEKDAYVGDTTSCDKMEELDFIETDEQPSNIALVENSLYAPMFYTDEVFVIDMLSRQIIDIIDLAPDNFIREPGIFREHSRPYDIAVYRNEAGYYALVSNFLAHEIAVIHLIDASGAPINRVVRKIENRAKLYESDQL